MYIVEELSVLFMARKCISSCWNSVGARTRVSTVSPAKPFGSGGFSAGQKVSSFVFKQSYNCQKLP